MVHCDSCESWENLCPFLHEGVGYDYNEPYTPKDHRQENCPLKEVEERPHGEWEWVTDDKYRCTNCGDIIQVKEVMNVPQYIACPVCEARMIYGHWISDWSESYGKDGFRCSICSRWSFEKKDKCDHCGIKMKEGEKQ